MYSYLLTECSDIIVSVCCDAVVDSNKRKSSPSITLIYSRRDEPLRRRIKRSKFNRYCVEVSIRYVFVCFYDAVFRNSSHFHIIVLGRSLDTCVCISDTKLCYLLLV